jgi:hypothetical protein
MMRIKPLAVLGMCLLAAGCATRFEPRYGPVPETAAANQGRTVRLMMKQGGPVELRNMRVEGDSIVGDAGYPPQRYAVATQDVQVITVSQVDHASPVNNVLGTIGLIAGAAILGALALILTLVSQIP